ncbi:MAG: 4-phosphoerythronate dehydrogenase [Myxococcota bacterium]
MIVADDAIPHLDAAFGQVRRCRGPELTRADLADATALLVRSVTRVDASLLEGTPVRFVGSATAGTDHVAREALDALGIAFAHAPGCNARAVTEYVLTALLAFGGFAGPVGVVGFGQIGRRLTTALRRLGHEVLVCDPPRAEAGLTDEPYLPLSTLLRRCATLTLHVPKVHHGPHATKHLLDAEALGILPDGALVLNTCRGDVVDNAALQAWLDAGRGTAVLDVWEGEPDVRAGLLDHPAVRLATPHIAGYTAEGKARGTRMIHDALQQHRGRAPTFDASQVLSSLDPLPPHADAQTVLRTLHPLDVPDTSVRALTSLDPAARPRAFEALRRGYRLRRELSAVPATAAAASLFTALQGLS